MPQDGSSNYQYPPGTPGIPDTTIESEAYNTFLDDLVTNDLNIPRPVHRGGTGASNANAALVNLTAEKATQVVTDYSAHLWLPGSFYSASSATAAPVAGHAFSGICYINEPLVSPPTNANVTVEARDMTDGKLYVRIKTAGVWAVAGWLIDGTDAFVNVTGDMMTGKLTINFPVPQASFETTSDNKMSFLVAGWGCELFASDDPATYGPYIYLGRSRGTIDVPTGVQQGDVLGAVVLDTVDTGGDNGSGASIYALADAPVAAGSIPSAWVFKTGTSGEGIERLRIKSDGKVKLINPVAIVDADQVPTKAYVDANADAASNIIINGDFRINQSGYVSAAALAAGVYGHDQWKAGAAGGDYSFTQLKSSTQITIASGKTLIQPIEDINVVGGSYVLSWTGTAQARAGVNTLTPAGAYAASPLLIAGQTAGTAMSVEFNTGTLGTVKLEKGSTASIFIARPYDQELVLCKRYFEWCPLDVSSYMRDAGEQFITPMIFSAEKRAIPTLGNVGPSPGRAQSLSNTLTYFGYASLYGCAAWLSASVIGTATMLGYRFSADARL